jgi:isopenicillin N synthase-like dioxygenase
MNAAPVIDLAPLLAGAPGAEQAIAGALDEALREWGAFELVGHGIPAATIEGAFDAARRFFAQPLEQRMAVRVDRHNRGYVPLHQTVYPGNRPDLKESFNLGLTLPPDDPDLLAGKPLHGINQWPGELPGFRAAVEACFDAMLGLGDTLLGPLARCMGMPPTALRALYHRPIAFMRLFHYPPESAVAAGEYGAAEHCDYGFITFLAQDPVVGFELRARDGRMVPVPPRQGGLIVNAGDMLAEVSGGAFRSAPHRVINPAPVGRHSIPFFFDPGFDALFPGLPETSAGEFLLAKFRRFYKPREAIGAAAAG